MAEPHFFQMGRPEPDVSTWEGRMSMRARARAEIAALTEPPEYDDEDVPDGPPRLPLPDRSTWPVPPQIQGASARDAFLWYVCRGWEQIFGEQPEIVTMIDHDFGHHVLRKGQWQLTLTNIDQFPDDEYFTGHPDVHEAIRKATAQRDNLTRWIGELEQLATEEDVTDE